MQGKASPHHPPPSSLTPLSAALPSTLQPSTPRTPKPQVWDTYTGEDLFTLEGHKNVVYAIAFNNPYGDKIVTGSFDKTCKLWDAYTGQLYYTLKGHQTEIVCLSFNPQSTIIATGSMDNTAKVRACF